MKIFQLRPQEFLFHEGDASESMYIIQSGKVAVKKTTQGKEMTLSELGPQSLIGEMGFFKNQPRTASAQALTEVSLVELPFKNLHEEFKGFPAWIKILVQTIQERLRVTNEKLSSISLSHQRLNQAEDKSVFSHQNLKIFILLNFLSQHQMNFDSEKNTSSFPLQHLKKDLAPFFEFSSAELDPVLKALSNLKILKIEQTKDKMEQLHILKSLHLNHFVHWYQGQVNLKADKRLPIEEKSSSLIHSLILMGKNEIQKEKNEVRVEESFSHQKEASKYFQIFKKQGLIKGLKESEQNKFSVTFSPHRLEKIFSFYKILMELQKLIQ